jgi:hypothetical protein
MEPIFKFDGVYRCSGCGHLVDCRDTKVPLLPEDLNESKGRGKGITPGVTDAASLNRK